MKEGIHPTYRDVCFVDLSNGFKFVTRSCAQTKETVKMDDGRELPLFKLETTSESHPFYTGTQRASTRWAAVSRSSATSSRASASRSKPASPVLKKAAAAAFFVACFYCPVRMLGSAACWPSCGIIATASRPSPS